MKTLIEVLKDAKENKVAIGHFNISDFSALRAITRAAKDLNVPIIIGTSPGEADYIGIKEASALVKATRDNLNHPIFLNADHFKDLNKVFEAAEGNYDSIIYDGAAKSFDENIVKTKSAVEKAKDINPDVLVEGELGYIGTSSKILDEIPEGAAIEKDTMTTPEQALQFVDETCVDLLAPAVGNIHGMMRNAKNPDLDIERISAIAEAVSVPLVLHGGSGISDEDFVAAIEAGISVVHINTEIRVAWREGLESALDYDKDQVAPYKILSDPSGDFSDPEEEIYKVVLKRLKLFSRSSI